MRKRKKVLFSAELGLRSCYSETGLVSATCGSATDGWGPRNDAKNRVVVKSIAVLGGRGTALPLLVMRIGGDVIRYGVSLPSQKRPPCLRNALRQKSGDGFKKDWQIERLGKGGYTAGIQSLHLVFRLGKGAGGHNRNIPRLDVGL